MTLQILSGGELVYEPWPWAGDWHMFSGNVDDFRYPDTRLDPLWVYRTQRNVRLVVDFLAKSYAQVRLIPYRMNDDDGDRERVERDHPLAKAIEHPGGSVTEYEFAHAHEVDLCLYERWAAFKLRDGGPSGDQTLVRLPPRLWRFVRDGLDRPTAVRWFDSSTDKYIDIPLDRVVWMDGYPMRDNVAYPPMQYLADLLIEEAASAASRVAMWRNGARISGFIQRPADAPDWGPKGREKFAAHFRKAYRAGGTSEGGTPVLEDGMTYQPVKVITPEQAQQIQARQLSTAEVASAFHVAPELVGAREGTYSNIQAFRELLYTETLGPMFMQTKQAYDTRFVPDFDDDALFVEHNVAEKLRMSFEEQARIGSIAVGGPFMTRNEWRRRMNLTDIEGGDELIVPLNVVTGDQASPSDSRPDLTGQVTPRVVPSTGSEAVVTSNGDGNQ